MIESWFEEFVRFLGHERFAIKSVRTGKKGAQEAHFDLINANKAIDYISMRNGKRQLWINVQRLKKGSKRYHDFNDIEAYTNVFIDIDAKKPDNRKNFAATDAERTAAVGQLPKVEKWLKDQGLKPGLAFESGNGIGLLLPIPPTSPTPEFIAKMAAFLKMVKKGVSVDVDTTTFDPPRVCGVIGTMNVKLENKAEGRLNQQRKEIYNIPTRDQDHALLEFIEGLDPDSEALSAWAEKYNEDRISFEDDERGHIEVDRDTIPRFEPVNVDFVREKLDLLLEADSKLRGLIEWTSEEQERHGNDRSDAEYGLAGKLIAAGFTDHQISWIMSNVSAIGKWREEGEHYHTVTLQKLRANHTEETRTEKSKLPDDIAERLKIDLDLLEDPNIIEGLRSLRRDNKLKFENLLKKASIRGGQREALLEVLSDLDNKIEEEKGDRPEVPEEIKWKARKILETGDPIKARCEYVARRVRGNIGVAKAFIYSCSSAYMPAEDKLHTDSVGASQGGKSVTAGAVHETYPPENVEILTEASPKSIYYFAKKCEKEGRSLDDTIIYINDAREDHIPVLKVFRDDGPGTPRNLTVVDGECVDLKVPGRPVVQSSSVLPLRDLDQQAVSRSFLATVADTDQYEEKQVRKKIRAGLEYGALLKAEDESEKMALQEMGRILRDEGIRSVVVPFDPTEPKGADRRGTGQFIRLIKISAHENQFQRPVLEMKDGSLHVLATYVDLKNAAGLWFEFEEAQAFKINHKVLTIFKSLPTVEPAHYDFTERSPSKNRIAKDTRVSPKSVERFLVDLYDAGLIFRKKASAPGNPYIFWTTEELRQKVMSQISASDNPQTDLGQIKTKNGCLKYLAKNCPDFLKSSLESFFSNYDIIRKENVKGIHFRCGNKTVEEFVSGGEINSYLSFLVNRVLNISTKAQDNEYLRFDGLSQMLEKEGMNPIASEYSVQDDLVSNHGSAVSNVHDDDLSLRGLLTRQKEWNAWDAERKRTPEPDRDPSDDEAAVLKRIASTALQNKPEVTPIELGMKAHETKGVVIPFKVVERWLATEGWASTGAKLNGSEMWIAPEGWSAEAVQQLHVGRQGRGPFQNTQGGGGVIQ